METILYIYEFQDKLIAAELICRSLNSSDKKP